jgi:hypothetical protein
MKNIKKNIVRHFLLMEPQTGTIVSVFHVPASVLEQFVHLINVVLGGE